MSPSTRSANNLSETEETEEEKEPDQTVENLTNDENSVSTAGATNRSRFHIPQKYKKVTEGTNRREKKTTTTDSRSTSEKTYNFPKKNRCNIRLWIPHSDNRVNAVYNVCKGYLRALITADATSGLIPNFERNRYTHEALVDPDKLPIKLSGIKVFFADWNFPRNTGDRGYYIYPHIYVGHTVEIEDLKADLYDWTQEPYNEHGFYVKMLQKELVREIGFLLYSTQAQDAGELRDRMKEDLNLEVGLRWKNIDSGARGLLREDQRVRALHVEVEASQVHTAFGTLSQLYNSKNKDRHDYPNGIRYRFVKLLKMCTNSTLDKPKVLKARETQKAFLAGVCTSTSWEIIQLDYQPIANQPTLRQMIMSINSSIKPSVPLFLSVDLNRLESGYGFQYGPDNKEEAECTIFTLLPLLKHQFPDAKPESFFSEEGKARCKDMAFDETTGVIIDKNAVEIDLEGDDELLGFTLHFEKTNPTNMTRPSERNTAVDPYDNNSISTFRTTGTHAGAPRPPPAPPRRPTSTQSVVSTSTEVTMQTIRTLEENVETLREAIKQQAEDQATQFATLTNLITTRLNSPQKASSSRGRGRGGSRR